MADLGFDIAGVGSLDSNLSFVSGRTCLIQNLARRFSTEKGSIPDAPTYGFPIVKLIGDAFVASRVARLAEDQLLGDERVTDADVTATYDAATKTATLVCRVEDSAGPFEFTVTVSDITTSLLSVSQ